MIELSVDRVRRLRERAQGLQARRSTEALVDTVRVVCGVQAQLSAAMMLALRARVAGLTPDEVEDAIRSRRLVRTWLMRGTLHLVPEEDTRWLAALLNPPFIAKGKRRRLQLGLDDDLSVRGLKAIRAILTNRSPLTRGEIVEQLAEHGITLDRRSQAPIHLIGLAALEGILCLGPDRPNGESTYVPMDQWVNSSKALTRETALAELARRYLTGYGPASVQDFAAWSGLGLTDAKQAWAHLRDRDNLTEVQVEGRGLWLLASATEVMPTSSESIVRLLPAFDTYLLGYADRDYVVRPEQQHEVYHGGQTVPVVLIDGAAAGVWRYQRQGKRLKINVHPFGSFDPTIRHQIEEEAENIGRFWHASITLSYSDEPFE